MYDIEQQLLPLNAALAMFYPWRRFALYIAPKMVQIPSSINTNTHLVLGVPIPYSFHKPKVI